MGDEPTSSLCLTCNADDRMQHSGRLFVWEGRDIRPRILGSNKPLDILLANIGSLQIIFFRIVIDLIEFAVPHRQPYSVLYHVS